MYIVFPNLLDWGHYIGVSCQTTFYLLSIHGSKREIFNLWFYVKFIANTSNTDDIVRYIRSYFHFFSDSAHNVMNGAQFIVNFYITPPHMVSYGFKCHHTLTIDN